MYKHAAMSTQPGSGSDDPGSLSRRNFVASIGTLTALGMLGACSPGAQQASVPASAPAPAPVSAPVLPVNTPGLDHFDINPVDLENAAKFYMGVFNTVLHAQPFRGSLRYFVLLGELNERREVSYLAIGNLRPNVPNIGHFCTSIVEWRRDSTAILAGMGEAFAAAGFGTYPDSDGVGSLFSDPDGIEIQFLPSPDTLVNDAAPSDLVPWNEGLVKPRGLDHMVLRVSNLERAVQYYEIIYGPVTSLDAASGQAVFRFANDTYLQLEQARYGYDQAPQIASAGIKVDAFDRQVVEAGLKALGAEVLPAGDTPGLLRFRDPDGLTIALRGV